MKFARLATFGLLAALSSHAAFFVGVGDMPPHKMTPPPETGSPAHDADFAVLLHWQDTRTEEQCAAAEAEESFGLKSFLNDNVGSPLLSKDEYKREKILLNKSAADVAEITTAAKYFFRRPRPARADDRIHPCVSTPWSPAYPSGHTSAAWIFALVLSELHPERRAAFEARAQHVALNRVLGGAHHPSDIAEGEALARQAFRKMMEESDFREELDELRP